MPSMNSLPASESTLVDLITDGHADQPTMPPLDLSLFASYLIFPAAISRSLLPRDSSSSLKIHPTIGLYRLEARRSAARLATIYALPAAMIAQASLRWPASPDSHPPGGPQFPSPFDPWVGGPGTRRRRFAPLRRGALRSRKY
jgi:hypothetical protein